VTIYLAEPGTPDHDQMQLLDLADFTSAEPGPGPLIRLDAGQDR
jgi:hypothetical protein